MAGALLVRERPGRRTFRFWQEGGGYDRNIVEATTLRHVIEYVHANPVRRGLCERVDEWPWSSWHHYAGVMPKGIRLPRVHGWPVGW